jgi:hypothetical protein
MSNAKLAAFTAALVLAVSSHASAQSAQATLKAPPHKTRAQLVTWCRNHPKATADCKDVRSDNREIRSDRKEVVADRKEVKGDIKAGDKKEAKQDAKELKSDLKDLRRTMGQTQDVHAFQDARKWFCFESQSGPLPDFPVVGRFFC